MKCLYCECTESKVIDSRSSDDKKSIRRRRECMLCGRRFTTYETIEVTPILVVKNDGTRESYNAEKVRRGIVKACEKRAVSADAIDAVPSHFAFKGQGRCARLGEPGRPCPETGGHSPRSVCS